ncbi:hypothetical protein WICPIJ_008108 [Wickerhamomyces pijperi]|uniref:Uncharacterized protein n=1 Tax=Wickerhamomyces pijperi TaxID=599730 RepID=A0A9P8TJD3_WICPI|nr:hypothetical protein WICPIJ_008108 [Wickerhamomyces pijperi]
MAELKEEYLMIGRTGPNISSFIVESSNVTSLIMVGLKKRCSLELSPEWMISPLVLSSKFIIMRFMNKDVVWSNTGLASVSKFAMQDSLCTQVQLVRGQSFTNENW